MTTLVIHNRATLVAHQQMKGANIMPGYYIHLATCRGRSLENRSFVLGVEAPDILKKHVKIYGGIEEAHTKYDSIRTSEMPEYCELQPRIQQKETANSNEGLHYGLSSQPDVKACWTSLSETQKASPFYRGYVWHLLTDSIMYSRLDIDTKFQKVLSENKGHLDMETLKKREVKKLHADWDKINARVHDTYSEVSLPDEVKELGVVQFITEGELAYVDWPLLKETIDYLRTFDPLYGDMDAIIETVLNS